jgi:hypothetical protein
MRWVEHVACRGGERCLQDFGWEAQKEETTGKTIDGRITLIWTLGIGIDGVKWVWLARDRV